ncbi:hypothetical protein GCM10009533_22500 [Saccharopolyspora spinosporotrichia]
MFGREGRARMRTVKRIIIAGTIAAAGLAVAAGPAHAGFAVRGWDCVLSGGAPIKFEGGRLMCWGGHFDGHPVIKASWHH